MRSLIFVGLIGFLAGLGLGVVLTTLSSPAPTPEQPAMTVAESPPQTSAHRDIEPLFGEMESPRSEPAPSRMPRPEAPPEDGPEERGRPPWMDWMGSNGPPAEIRTNREAMRAWMAERQQERATTLRTNFAAKAKLADEEVVRFDVLMAAMNMRLKEKTVQWREALDSGAMTRPEVRARAMNEISQAMVLTYDEMDRSMPTGWREVAGEDFNLMTFVDPTTMHELRPLMRGGFRGGGPGGGRDAPPPQ